MVKPQTKRCVIKRLIKISPKNKNKKTVVSFKDKKLFYFSCGTITISYGNNFAYLYKKFFNHISCFDRFFHT